MNEMIAFYPLFFFAGLAFLFLVMNSAFGPSKSKAYRQTLSDMYIAGKIKQIAEKDGIDINNEFLEFAKVTKNKKIDLEALDNTVERELQEKISEDKKTATSKK